MTLLDETEQASLREADHALSRFQRALETAAQNGALDREAIFRLRETANELVRRFNSSLPPQIDPTVSNEIKDRLIAILTPGLDEQAPLDAADEILVEAEAIRHILRDLLQEHPGVDARDAKESIEILNSWLPNLPSSDLSELLGVSTRQIQRLRQNGDRSSTHRMRLVVRLVAILRHAWTDEGVFAWFSRDRQELGGVAPIELLDDPVNERALMLAARAGRVQVAS